MFQLRSRASDPGLRRRVTFQPELIADERACDERDPRKQASVTRILLGPHAFQCLEIFSDSSSSNGEEADDEGNTGDDPFGTSTPESLSSPAVRYSQDGAASGTSTSTQIAGFDPSPELLMSPPRDRLSCTSISRGIHSIEHQQINNLTAYTQQSIESEIGSANGDRPYNNVSGPTTSAYRYATLPEASRSQSTPPVMLSAESSVTWCRTQPGLEVNLLLTDDHVEPVGGGSGDEASRTIKRMEMLDQLFSHSAQSRYSSSMMPHAKASRRPVLSTIPSGECASYSSIVLHETVECKTDEVKEAFARVTSSDRQTLQAQEPDHKHSTLGHPGTLNFQRGSCDACDRLDDGIRKVRMIPCAHVVCSSCFGSAISAVSAKSGPSKCTACLCPVESFTEAHCFTVQSERDIRKSSTARSCTGSGSGRTTGTSSQDESSDESRQRSGASTGTSTKPTSAETSDEEKYREPIVLRIDNVAWTVCPVHILLERFDGRTRDYLYIEVSSHSAARQILQTRQNSLMPCGPLSHGKRRPVTITLVPYQELLEELRPRCAVELDSLLKLCEAAVTIPHVPTLASSIALHDDPAGVISNGTTQKQRQVHDRSAGHISGAAHFVKSRHGPFYALMSVLSKLGGRKSPAYWDLYRVTSGAIAALASAVDRSPFRLQARSHAGLTEDKRVLSKLKTLHHRCFIAGPASPS